MEQEFEVVSAYWEQHCSVVVVVTANKAEGIEEGIAVDKMVDVEFTKEIGSLDGNSSIQETKNLVGVVAEPRGSRS